MALQPKGVLIPAALVAALGLAGALWTGGFRPPFPRPQEMRIQPGGEVEAGAALSAGMRRIGADLGFLRLLQYYGTRPNEEQHAYLEAGPEHHRADASRYGREEAFGELKDRTLAILSMDPYFSHAVLFSAGALAFNLGRGDEAVEVLEEGLRRTPDQWRYHAYLAAIGYRAARDKDKVAEALLPVALEPDSPALIKQVTAFMLKRIGRRAEAARVYRLILETTKDEGYRDQAERSLAELGNP